MPDKDAEKSALQKIDEGWQRLEARLCAWVLVAEIASLTLWISLKGLSADYEPGGNASGLVYRAMLGCLRPSRVIEVGAGFSTVTVLPHGGTVTGAILSRDSVSSVTASSGSRPGDDCKANCAN